MMSSDEAYDGTGDLGFSIYDQICNLRRQAHSAAQQVRDAAPADDTHPYPLCPE